MIDDDDGDIKRVPHMFRNTCLMWLMPNDLHMVCHTVIHNFTTLAYLCNELYVIIVYVCGG